MTLEIAMWLTFAAATWSVTSLVVGLVLDVVLPALDEQGAGEGS